MRKFSFLLLVLMWGLFLTTAPAQNRDFPNAVHAKLNFFDYGSLNDDDFKLGEGFEFGYFRNVAPFLNIGIPFKLGLAKLPMVSGNTITTSLDVVFQLSPTREGAKISPYVFAGGGYFLEEFENGHPQFPFGVGANFRISEYAFINAQAEYRKSTKDLRDNAQLGVGFVYLLHKAPPKPELPPQTEPDKDNDGTPDLTDLCPDEPGPASTTGCPDTDEDGIADKDDDCPTMAGTLNGCPDTDRDGVADKDDECPDEAGTVKGCPDSDYDGVANKDDKCPREPGPADNNGCPWVKDSDGDGIADDDDPCPDAAGTVNGCPDSDGDSVADHLDKCPNSAGPATNFGCPEVKKETKERLEFATKNVQYETGRADLKIASFKILDDIVDIMSQYPDYKLEIRGYTDDVGRSAKNLELSKARARACYDYLVYRGIEAERLNSKGFGEAKPIASNKTEKGRERNRRVEFELVLDYGNEGKNEDGK